MKYSILVPIIYLASCMNTIHPEVKPEYNETSLRAFVLGTLSLNEPPALDSLGSILAAASKDSVVFRKTVSFLTEPFGSPNSSYRNQKMYTKILETEISSNWYNAAEKEIARIKLKLSQQNNVGSVANDFPYTTPGGDVKRMYDLHPNFLLLYFNNPECEACKQTKAELSQSTIIDRKIKSGELKVLSIYMGTDKR